MSESPMDPRLQSAIRRYVSYGWKTSLILFLLHARYDAPVSPKCVENLRRDRDCPPSCWESCPIRKVERWVSPELNLDSKP